MCASDLTPVFARAPPVLLPLDASSWRLAGEDGTVIGIAIPLDPRHTTVGTRGQTSCSSVRHTARVWPGRRRNPCKRLSEEGFAGESPALVDDGACVCVRGNSK